MRLKLIGKVKADKNNQEVLFMGANNFVQLLSNDDYISFAKRILHLDDSYELWRINEESDYVRLELSRMCLFRPTKIVIDFRDFDYTIQINNNYHKENIKTQTQWRIFMAQKFGERYIDAYKVFVDEYIAGKLKQIDMMKMEFYNEILGLKDRSYWSK